MKTVLLTTFTYHHSYFAAAVDDRFPWRAIFLENDKTQPFSRTRRGFEKAQHEYECKELKGGLWDSMNDIAPTKAFPCLNDAECVTALRALAPEVVVVFGTGRLKPSVIEVASRACLNLHGGDPEEYRGLDSHLWAIYHGDWKSLVTTLHHVDAQLDTGDIVLQEQLQLTAHVKLHELRAINTRACVNLVLMALDLLHRRGELPRRCQKRHGRYYSSMPSELKRVCARKFREHVKRLE